MQYANAEEHIRTADVVITGEGKLDGQTLQGKLVTAIAGLARQHKKPAIAFCGSNEVPIAQLQKVGLAAAFAIIDNAKDFEEAVTNASAILTNLASGVAANYLLNNDNGWKNFE